MDGRAADAAGNEVDIADARAGALARPPELYDRFALASLEAAKKVHELIEPFETMRDFATARACARGVTNVEFRDGIAEDLSVFGEDSFDVAVSMYGAPFPWDTDDSFVYASQLATGVRALALRPFR